LRFVSFLENDFSKDEFTDIDHVWYPEHDVELDANEVQYILVDFWLFLLFLFFFFLGPDDLL
jgi:hypothetical protein